MAGAQFPGSQSPGSQSPGSQAPSSKSSLVVVSNRGPLSFSLGDDGELEAVRGGGGLVSSLGPLVREAGATWIAAAITDADRQAADEGLVEAEGFKVRSLAVDPATFRMAYDVVSNATLWFLHHGLFDLARKPRFDRRWWEAWEGYRTVNRCFAEAVIEHADEGATVLVQDYHLFLVGAWLARERPDLHAVHFTHTPFADPEALRVLPSSVAEELLVGMTSHVACGFHARRWAANYEACCREVLGFTPPSFVSPISPDRHEMATTAESDDCVREIDRLDRILGGRQLIARVD
ncbi:MAG: trehalose 6-phosphate synthase, partial [Actinomycetota bacterium]|nr:trehalose 6-phosphate synthase [Actinomycetota bacterium]